MRGGSRGRRREPDAPSACTSPTSSTQSHLVTSVSVPNLIGLALGAGRGDRIAARAAERRADRRRAGAVLARPGGGTDSITACGWASVALLVTLSWVLPWYVLWVLPLAALSSSRRLRVDGARAGRLPDHRLGAGLRPALERDRLPSGENLARAPAPALRQGAAQLVPEPSGRRGGAGARACAAPHGAWPARRRSREAAVGRVARRRLGPRAPSASRSAEACEGQLAVARLRALVLGDRDDARRRRARAGARAASR